MKKIILILILLVFINGCGTESSESIGNIKEENLCYNDACLSSDYKQYFEENPTILTIINSIYSEEILNYFVGYINELENTGQIEIEEPINFPQPKTEKCFYLPEEQEKRIHGAKIAHTIWLDKNKKVPWALKEYSYEELEILLAQNFNSCGHSIDYSPSEAYYYAKQFVKNNELNSFYAIIDDLRKDFRHGFVEEESYNTFDSLKNDLTTYSDFTGRHKRVSRKGCHSMVEIIVGLSRSINIPAYKDKGWYGEGWGHASGFFPSIQKILTHGDDIYDKSLDKTPTEELLMSYNYFNNKLEPCGKSNSCSEKASFEFIMGLFIKYPGSVFTVCVDDSECETCINDIIEAFGNILSSQELQNLKEEMTDKVCP